MNSRTSEPRYSYVRFHEGDWSVVEWVEAKENIIRLWHESGSVDRRAMLGLLTMHAPELIEGDR